MTDTTTKHSAQIGVAARVRGWLVRSAPPPAVSLTPEKLRERFALNSPPLVAELYASALRGISDETARLSRLDSKATSLLTAAGLSVAVATALVARSGIAAGLGPAWIAVFLLALAAGFAAAACAVAALFVRDQSAPHVDAMLDETTLQESNAADTDDDGKSPFALMVYQKRLAPHYWSVVLRQQPVLARKARWVKRGQACFLAFLFVLFVICIRAGWTLVSG